MKNNRTYEKLAIGFGYIATNLNNRQLCNWIITIDMSTLPFNWLRAIIIAVIILQIINTLNTNFIIALFWYLQVVSISKMDKIKPIKKI